MYLAVLIELWQHWIHPKINPDDPAILGLPLIWWGRGGKFLEFASGTVIILDLIGSEKLHHWGRTLNQARLYKKLTTFWRSLWRKLTGSVRDNFSSGNLGCAVFMIIILAVSIPLNQWLYNWITGGKGSQVWKWYFIIVWFLDSIVYIVFILTIFLPLILIGGSYVAVTAILAPATMLNFLIFRPAARVLENPHLEWNAKLISFVVLFVGFFLDILAS